MAQNWTNKDGLFIQFGTDKATATTAGDYLAFGDTREIEVTIDLTTLTTSPVIQANTTFFPTGAFIERVQVDTETAAVGGTSFSVGLTKTDRTTVVSNTEFLAAAPIADHNAAGARKDYVPGVTGVGVGVGTTAGFPGYITALAAGTYSAGKVKVRIFYRGIGLITQ